MSKSSANIVKGRIIVMRTLYSQTYNIAWFKLADFVARGEKERALSVHRLLMHSVPDVALTYQLEGDILLAFDDDAALDRYHIAANLYKKSLKFQQAISVYEHVSLFKEDEKIFEALLDMYVLIKHKTGMFETFSRVAKLLLQKQKSESLINLMHRCLVQLDKPWQALLYARLVRSMMLYDQHNVSITGYIYHTLELFAEALAIQGLKAGDLQNFLADVKALNDLEYQKAELYLKELL